MNLTAEEWVNSLGWSWARQERIDALARLLWAANKRYESIQEAFSAAERFEVVSCEGFARAAEADARRKACK